MQTHPENGPFPGMSAAAMQDSPRHSAWSDRDSNASYRYVPVPPGIKHPFSQTRYNEGARSTPSRSHPNQSQNHNQTWQQKADNYRHQSNPRQAQHRHDDDNSSQHSYNQRPRSNMRHPSAQRRNQQQQGNTHHDARAVSADRRRGFSDSPMRNDNYQRQSYGGGQGPRHHTPHRQNWPNRPEPGPHPTNQHSQPRPGPPPAANRSQSNPHSTWSNYSAPRVSDPSALAPLPSAAPPKVSAPPPAPSSEAPSEMDNDDSKGNGPVKLPSTFEITDDLKKKYHMLESADGKIILLRKTPRGKRGGVKHRKNKLETVESVTSDTQSNAANEAKSEDSDHSSSDVITVSGNGQRQPPPPPPRHQPGSPKRVQSIVSQLNRQISTHSATPSVTPGSPRSLQGSPVSSPHASRSNGGGGHHADAAMELPATPTADDVVEVGDAADAAGAESQQKKDALRRKRLEELVKEINDLRFAKQRAEEAQEQLSIQTQSLLQEKSSLLQRVGEREKQIANLQERLEYVEQECEDLRQPHCLQVDVLQLDPMMDPQLLSVLSNGALGGLDQLMPGDESALLDYAAASGLNYTAADLYRDHDSLPDGHSS